MTRQTDSDLRALLPAGVTEISLLDARWLGCFSFEADDRPAHPTPARELAVANLRRSRWRTCHQFRVVPAGAGVNCDHAAHVLMSKLNPDGTVTFFEGELASAGVQGALRAEFAYLAPTWPPTGKANARTVHFVCGFCAAEIAESWAEGAAEAAMS